MLTLLSVSVSNKFFPLERLITGGSPYCSGRHISPPCAPPASSAGLETHLNIDQAPGRTACPPQPPPPNPPAPPGLFHSFIDRPRARLPISQRHMDLVAVLWHSVWFCLSVACRLYWCFGRRLVFFTQIFVIFKALQLRQHVYLKWHETGLLGYINIENKHI